MNSNVRIENAIPGDMEFIFFLYEKAIRFQKKSGFNIWQGYDKAVLTQELEAGLLHKLIINGRIALVFSAIYSDKLLWFEREKEDAVYVHRLVVNPEMRGQKLFRHVFEWMLEDAKKRGRKYLRLDTWGDNPKLTNYYINCGFRLLGIVAPESTELLPKHYNCISLSLLEIKIE